MYINFKNSYKSSIKLYIANIDLFLKNKMLKLKIYDPEKNIGELKAKYAKLRNISNDGIIFLFNGRILKDDETIRQCDIEDEDTIIAIKEENNNRPINIIIENIKGVKKRLTVLKNMTIRKVKEEFFKSNNNTIKYNIYFLFNGELLRDEKTIEYYDIEDNDIIYVGLNKLGG